MASFFEKLKLVLYSYSDQSSEIGAWKYCFWPSVSWFPTTGWGLSPVSFAIMPDAPEDSRANKFTSYTVQTCISEDYICPPTVWASCETDAKHITTYCENSHRHFRAQFSHHIPIYLILWSSLKTNNPNHFICLFMLGFYTVAIVVRSYNGGQLS